MIKPTKWHVHPVKTQISLSNRPKAWVLSYTMSAQWKLWSDWATTQTDQSLPFRSMAKDPRFLHADSEDSDQTGRMPRLIWVFAGRTLILLVLSCRTSFFGCLKFFTVCFTFIQLIRIAILTNKTEVKLKGLKKSVKQKRKKKRTHTCTCNEQFYTTFEILISIINYMW